MEMSVRSIAVPVRNGAGTVVAGMNVIVQAGRVSLRDMRTLYLPHLQAAARGLVRSCPKEGGRNAIPDTLRRCACLRAGRRGSGSPVPVEVGPDRGPGDARRRHDLIARTLAEKLTVSLGQPVVVENKPGASNNLGTDFVAKSPPDGYTLVIVASSHATNKHLFKALPYDPVKDFEPVVYTHVVPLVLAVHPSIPAKSVAELTRMAESESQRGDLRHQRPRQLAAHGGRALHEHERHEDAAGAVQGQLRCAPRPARRTHHDPKTTQPVGSRRLLEQSRYLVATSATCASVSIVPIPACDGSTANSSARPSTSIKRSKAPTAPVWTPRYSPSLHRNVRATRRNAPGT